MEFPGRPAGAVTFAFTAKHIGMKQTKPSSANEPNPQTRRVVRMLRRIQPWLQSQRARMATFGEMEKWTGTPEDTIRGWFAGQGNPTAEFLISLLERIPNKARLDILDEFSRVYPTLEHSRVAGDRTIVSRLVTLLAQPRGLAYVQGSTAEARTFITTALGHAFWMLSGPSRRVLGLDVHASDWFVPVPGVVYLNNLLQRNELLRAVRLQWPTLRNGETPLVVFNGIWSAFPELHGKIRQLAGRCLILVADESSIDGEQDARHLPPRTTVITISPPVSESGSIGIQIRAL